MSLLMDVTTQRLSFENARACVAGCADAYRDPPDIFDVETDIQVRVVRGQSSLRGAWVGFFCRGTFNTEGWLRDFDPTTVPFFGGRAHKDTVDGVEAVLSKIKLAIQDKRDSVIIGGHSKGAREAQNLARRLYDLGYKVSMVYTYGTPRGFTYDAARNYDERLGRVTWRFVNGSDIVCRVPFPPKWWHTNQEIFLPVGDVFGVKAFHSRDWKEDASLAYKLACDGRELFRDFKRHLFKQQPAFADHKIAAYCSTVNALQYNPKP